MPASVLVPSDSRGRMKKIHHTGTEGAEGGTEFNSFLCAISVNSVPLW
jgi:hypothetical protein